MNNLAGFMCIGNGKCELLHATKLYLHAVFLLSTSGCVSLEYELQCFS